MTFSVPRQGNPAGVQHARGFSLIEMIIAVALLALALTLGMPTFSGVLASMRVRGVAESMLNGLQMARSEAAHRNGRVSFRIDAEQGGAWSVVLVSDGSTLQSKPASEGSTVLAQADLGNTVTFNNLGQRVAPVGGALTIVFTNPAVGECQPAGNVRCLNVVAQASGQVRLCDPQRTAPDPQAC